MKEEDASYCYEKEDTFDAKTCWWVDFSGGRGRRCVFNTVMRKMKMRQYCYEKDEDAPYCFEKEEFS